MEDLIKLGAEALRKAALNTGAKEYLINHPELFHLIKKAADRYIGGEYLDETIGKAIATHRKGLPCSIEFMGENVKTMEEAELATDEFVAISRQLITHQLSSTISLDLSHIGLALSEERCRLNLDKICRAAATAGVEVMISAEGPEMTDAVLHMYKSAVIDHPHLGITLQAYLYRTKNDFSELLDLPGRIRIVKGAFAASQEIAMPRGSALNDAYLGYVDTLLSTGHKCSIATHDHQVQQAAVDLIQRYHPAPGTYEFESLYGIQTGQLLALHEAGHPARLYIVYGKEWYLYLCNRIAENPLNLFQALADIVG
jgi:proline dehydrogenase